MAYAFNDDKSTYDLENLNTVQSEQVLANTSVFQANNYVMFYKVGKIVTVRAFLPTKSRGAIPQNDTLICSVPSGYRPVNDGSLYFMTRAFANVASERLPMLYYSVDTEINVATVPITGTYISCDAVAFTFTYIAE